MFHQFSIVDFGKGMTERKETKLIVYLSTTRAFSENAKFVASLPISLVRSKVPGFIKRFVEICTLQKIPPLEITFLLG